MTLSVCNFRNPPGTANTVPLKFFIPETNRDSKRGFFEMDLNPSSEICSKKSSVNPFSFFNFPNGSRYSSLNEVHGSQM